MHNKKSISQKTSIYTKLSDWMCGKPLLTKRLTVQLGFQTEREKKNSQHNTDACFLILNPVLLNFPLKEECIWKTASVSALSGNRRSLCQNCLPL